MERIKQGMSNATRELAHREFLDEKKKGNKKVLKEKRAAAQE